MKKFVGLNLDLDSVEKLKNITFITGKDRTELIREGIKLVIDSYYPDVVDKFKKYTEEEL